MIFLAISYSFEKLDAYRAAGGLVDNRVLVDLTDNQGFKYGLSFSVGRMIGKSYGRY